MNIRMTKSRRGTIFEALCDLCGQPIELSETCTYLTPQSPKKGENLVCHGECGRNRSAPGYWAQMHRVRWLLEELLDNHRQRHPVLTEFLATLPNSQKQE